MDNIAHLEDAIIPSSSLAATNDVISTATASQHSDDIGSDLGHLNNGTEQEVIGLLLQANESEASNVADSISDEACRIELENVSDVLPEDIGVPSVQAVTLADGSTAFIQNPKGNTKFLEGQTVTLEDGTTAVVQGFPGVKDEIENRQPKFVDGQAVQLEDGTTAYLHTNPKEGLQAIQLEDGSTAYIAHTGSDNLFNEAANLDAGALGLDQLPAQANVGTESGNAECQDGKESTYVMLSGGVIDKTVVSPGDKVFKCLHDNCGRLYTTQHHLKVHERSHTGDRPFKCDFPCCGKAFATGYGLKSHTRVHTGEKPYKCPEEECTKAFKTSGDLQKHVRTHTGERPFKCPFEGCERSFTTSNIRKVHIRTHTGERPYICQDPGCGRAFASATNYKNHVRIHTGEKPYVCTVQGCGKRFTEYSSLYKHHVVHTHSKPYVCNHCGKNYRQTSTLAMHKRTAHGEELTVEQEVVFGAQQGIDPGILEPPDKRARLHYSLTGPVTEDGDGTLIINTTERQQHVSAVNASDVNAVINTGDSSIMSLAASQTPSHATTMQQLQQQQHTVASITLGEDGQKVYVVTYPAQLEALQHLDTQTRFQIQEVADSLEPSLDTDSPLSHSIIHSSGDGIINPTVTDANMLSFHTE